MALGSKKQAQATEAEAVLLEPRDAYDQAIVSVAAWLQELRARRTVLEEAEHEMRVAGLYPPQNVFGGLFDVAERVERSAIKVRPELFGMPPAESREREHLRAARQNLQHAETSFAKVKEQLSGVNPESQQYRAVFRQLQLWAQDLRRYRLDLAAALQRCEDLTPTERKEIAALREAAEAEQITVSL